MRHFLIETFYSVRKYAIRKAGDDGIYFLTTLIAILLVFSIRVFADNDIEKKFEAGEIIASSEDVEGTKVKRGRVVGLVDAPTKVTYKLLTDPGGSIPNFLINFGTEVTMPDIIRAIRKRSNEIMHKEK